MPSIEERHAAHHARLTHYRQSHLLAYWAQLDDAQRRQLLDDLDQIDFEGCRPLINSHVVNRPASALPERIDAAEILPATADAAHAELYQRAQAAGQEAIRSGKVAAFTVAGGQGTRLGFDGPKGAFPISPVRSASLFQLFAESLRGTERRYGLRPRWYIMTSPANHQATISFYEDNDYFGLSAADVMFFPQGQMPAFHADGRIGLAQPHRVALGPDGHGGSLRALAESGALEDMRSRGVEQISYFQVDNPLVRPMDPLFIGLHIVTDSQMSSKAVIKADDTERVGNFCTADGKLAIIEYSDLPEVLAHARNPEGTRRFNAGSIAVHILSREFVERLTAPEAATTLPWHRAEKKVPVVGPDGRVTTPTSPNVVKLEMLVFDAIPLADRAMAMYTPREEQFSPVKNAEGVDSAVTARRDLIRRAARWLEGAGCVILRDASGEPDLPLEISPEFALDAGELRERLRTLPELVAGRPLLVE